MSIVSAIGAMNTAYADRNFRKSGAVGSIIEGIIAKLSISTAKRIPLQILKYLGKKEVISSMVVNQSSYRI